MLRSKMGRPRLAMLGCGGRGKGTQIGSVSIGSHNRVACAIAPGIAGIERAPGHVLVGSAWILGGGGNEGARRGGWTRLEHRYRAAVLGNRLNQRSHIVAFRRSGLGRFTSVRVGEGLDKATRGILTEWHETVFVRTDEVRGTRRCADKGPQGEVLA